MTKTSSPVTKPDWQIPRLLDEAAAAHILGVAPSTLAVWRSTKRYPLPYIKCGRLVRYREDDLAMFLDSRRIGFDHVRQSR
jgi:hypothetical protein